MHDNGYFDEDVAAHYDEEEGQSQSDAIGPAVSLLAGLAGKGRALEFAIGTGRVALPLFERGVHVEGIELSKPMVECMRSKPGGADIPVTIGDISTTRIDGAFALVYLLFNTINNLTTQDAQVACFMNAAAHLEPGGCFLVEVGVPPLQRLSFGETLIAFGRSETHWGIDEIDVASQRFTSHHLLMRSDGLVHRSIPFRYVWPAELDLMARLAGLSLKVRWGSWQRDPFTRFSTSHVSVWEKRPV